LDESRHAAKNIFEPRPAPFKRRLLFFDFVNTSRSSRGREASKLGDRAKNGD